MIPRLEEVLDAHARFARARRIDPQRSEPLIAESLRLAADLSDGRPEDEPAAMLFAPSPGALNRLDQLILLINPQVVCFPNRHRDPRILSRNSLVTPWNLSNVHPHDLERAPLNLAAA
jgi:hypothetical protein